MSFRNRAGRGICLLVALATVLATQSHLLGATPQSAQHQTIDVSLQANGEFRGQVIDQQGRALASSKIALIQRNQAVSFAETDQAGRFVVRGLRPGAYEVQTAVGTKLVRVWAPRTAPPVAQQSVLIVGQGTTVRSQFGGGVYGPAIRGAIAGGLVTGLAYWAIDHNDDDAS